VHNQTGPCPTHVYMPRATSIFRDAVWRARATHVLTRMRGGDRSRNVT